jgi:hypothetical protein
MSTDRFPQYASVLRNLTDAAFADPARIDPRLSIARDGELNVHYAPFDHVETGARLVLVGLTPGHQQMRIALATAREALRAGAGEAEASARAKRAASFAGTMRNTLSKMLDHIGLQALLDSDSCQQIWDTPGAVHYTSALRYPVFIDGKNYAGAPKPLKTPVLRQFIERELTAEARMLPNAVWLPLGGGATEALKHLVANGVLARERVFDGLPHPSGANAERVAYFMGRKQRQNLSPKTSPDKIDAKRGALEDRVAQLLLQEGRGGSLPAA